MTNIINELKNTAECSLLKENPSANISKTERFLSLATGSYVFLKGIRNIFSHPIVAATELSLGYALLNRGYTGHCSVSAKLNEEELGPEPVLVVKEI